MARSALAISAAVTIVTLGWLFWFSHYGIEFTDEGFYLGWMADPWQYKATPYLFGYVYRPLYILVGGDVAQLRQGNISITFALAWLLCFVLFHRAGKLTPGTEAMPFSVALILSAALSISAFLLLNEWTFVTPNYNSLALQALTVAGVGLLVAQRSFSRLSVAGWILIGLGGWLAFMAKPTTAAALGLVVPVYLFAAGKLSLRLLVLSATTSAALLLCSALIIDGSVVEFALRLKKGAEFMSAQSERYTISGVFRWDWFQFKTQEIIILASGTVLVFLSVYLSFSGRIVGCWVNILISFLCALSALAVISGSAPVPSQKYVFKGLQIWVVPFGIWLAVFLRLSRNRLTLMVRDGVTLALCFACFPFAYAIGTDINYWWSAACAGFFWVLCGVVILIHVKSASWRVFLPVAAATQVITIVILYVSIEQPFRHTQPLRFDDHVVSIRDSTVIVSRDFAKYLDGLQLIANRAGFEGETPMIDMTGHYPGALNSLAAKQIGWPWLVGGYKGSEVFVASLLDLVGCDELARAWILVEDRGPRQLPLEMLKRYGIDVESDYVQVGTLMSPRGEFPESYKQRLLKPGRAFAVALSACEQGRQIH